MATIITVPDPRLRGKSKPTEIHTKVLELVNTLRETVVNKEGKVIGVGISAVQIGVPLRVFLAYSSSSRRFLTFINPEILWLSKTLTRGLPGGKYEGCLSIPNVWGLVNRNKTLKIRYQTEAGTVQVRKFTGITATVIQHEYDHLEGILFTDRVIAQNHKLYKIRKDKFEKESFFEIKL